MTRRQNRFFLRTGIALLLLFVPAVYLAYALISILPISEAARSFTTSIVSVLLMFQIGIGYIFTVFLGVFPRLATFVAEPIIRSAGKPGSNTWWDRQLAASARAFPFRIDGEPEEDLASAKTRS